MPTAPTTEMAAKDRKESAKAVSARLNAAVVDALADATVRQRLADLGMEIFPPDQQAPEVLSALHKAEAEKWGPSIKAANISGQRRQKTLARSLWSAILLHSRASTEYNFRTSGVPPWLFSDAVFGSEH